MIMKQILGVHGKTPNLAVHAELGLEPLCFKAFKLLFKYYNRLIKIEQPKDYVYDLLRSAVDEDKQLHSQNCLSWGEICKTTKNYI
jgi:hypothetical protein